MRRFTYCLVASLMLTGALVAAPGPKTDTKPERTAGEAIRKALDSSGNFDFTGVTLAGVMSTLSEQYKINIVVDRMIIQQMGLEPEIMNVELKMKDGKLRSALRAIVGQYNLTFAIVGDSLLITTEEIAVYRQLKQRINVDFEKVSVIGAIKDLSSQYGVNVVIDPRLSKIKPPDLPVTLKVDDVPFEAAIRLLCEMADLKPARMGNVIFVTTEARADKLKDGDSLVPMPRIQMPGAPDIFLGGIGGGAGIAIPAPPILIPSPAKADNADPPPPAKDELKKEDPKKQ